MISIAGMMTNSGGDLYHVWLEAELPGPYEVEDAQIARPAVRKRAKQTH